MHNELLQYMPMQLKTNQSYYNTRNAPNLQKRKVSFQFLINFTEFLNNKDNHNHNVIIEAKDKKIYTAHSSVLKYRSLYFRKGLENIIHDENNIKTIIKPNISDDIFDIILKYIYSSAALHKQIWVTGNYIITKIISEMTCMKFAIDGRCLLKQMPSHSLNETFSRRLNSHGFRFTFFLWFKDADLLTFQKGIKTSLFPLEEMVLLSLTKKRLLTSL
ncbi:hypothetical protein Glove_33g178 [Diversispora epigaea]|uniref:BTB domain-containing protein n=1 Tax=Diversispora epigaea TaxID=1348612 RepID=A0A397JRY7_9GLOM|nr:hypothetical protein Glove_33g178 [Diversispora epigaea]